MVWLYRRYLGKAGTIIAMILMLISPYMLYYGRYVRNEAYAAFAGVALLWAILRYLETGKDKYTYWVTFATVLHFTAKETAFIYTAQILSFLGFYFLYQIARQSWPKASHRNPFLILFLAATGNAQTPYLKRSLSRLSEIKTALSTENAHYHPIFGEGDDSSSIIRGISCYGCLEIDPGGNEIRAISTASPYFPQVDGRICA
ncbi:MAG: hypothetical protein HGA75_17195 [Thiobacillus sp.]|nr:hypothetical protein [Thiobacillus sp.]